MKTRNLIEEEMKDLKKFECLVEMFLILQKVMVREGILPKEEAKEYEEIILKTSKLIEEEKRELALLGFGYIDPVGG
jgi:hypothetical protein